MNKEIKIKVKGIKGDSPTDEQLVELIKPLIPKPLKGEPGPEPSDEKLVSLIAPLIPEPKDGETPTDERIVSLIKPLIVLPEIAEQISETPDSIISKANRSNLKIDKSVLDVDWKLYENKPYKVEEIIGLPEKIRKLEYSHAKAKNADSQVSGSGAGGIKEIIAGTNITVDNTNLGYPVISAAGGPETQNLQEVTDIGATTTNAITSITNDDAFSYLVKDSADNMKVSIGNGATGLGFSQWYNVDSEVATSIEGGTITSQNLSLTPTDAGGSLNWSYGNSGGTGTNTLYVQSLGAPGGFAGNAYLNVSAEEGAYLTYVSTTNGTSGLYVYDGTATIQAADSTFFSADINGLQLGDGGTGIDLNGSVIYSNGPHWFAAGSASSPSIAFAADNDVGIFRPAANSIAIATSGVERARIDATGNFGIGTTTPSQKLEVIGNARIQDSIFMGSTLYMYDVNAGGYGYMYHDDYTFYLYDADDNLTGLTVSSLFATVVLNSPSIQASTQMSSPVYYASANGSATNAAFSRLTDLNTGMFFPSADTLGFTAGGVQAMTVTTAGISITGTIGAAQTTTNAVIVGLVGGNARGTTAIEMQSARTVASQVASGTNSIAIGTSNTSSGASSTTVGRLNTTTGLNATTYGFTNTNSAQGATVVGVSNSNNTNGTNSTIVGNGNTLTGASITSSLIAGQGNTCNAGSSAIIGRQNTASGTSNDFSLAVGYFNTISAGSTLALGRGNTASGSFASAIGHFSVASATNSHAFGSYLTNSLSNSVQVGISGEYISISSTGVDFVTSGGGTFTVNGVPLGSGGQTPWVSTIDGAGYSLYNATISDVGNVLSVDPANRTLNDISGTAVASWGNASYAFHASMFGSNYVTLDDGTNAISSFGNVKMQGLSSGVGPPATILTNFNLYVDTATGMVYVD